MTVTARHDGTGIRSVSAEGHTGFANIGSDIVCASVSSLMQALWLGLEDVIGVEDLEASADPKIPLMRLDWDGGGDSAQVLAQTVVRSIRAIAGDYPEYVEVNEVFELFQHEEDDTK